jgi:hypothetical protein
MLSPDNDDRTAENLWRLYERSGLRRDRCVHWNAVPWYVGDKRRIRAATSNDVALGAKWLSALIAILPRLQLVVAMGRRAEDGVGTCMLNGDVLVPWLAVPHPSQRVLNVDPTAAVKVERAFAIAASRARRDRR